MTDGPAVSDNQIVRRDSLREGALLDEVLAFIVDVINGIPPATDNQTDDPRIGARRLVVDACCKAAAVSGALALQPQVAGWPTILSELAAIWRLQAQMVANVGAVFGKNGKLTEESILYCLCRHATAQSVRELVMAMGERDARRGIRPSTEDAAQNIRTEVIRRMTRRRSSRWLPVLGAIAVAAYAYYDTDQVGRAAIEFFNEEVHLR